MHLKRCSAHWGGRFTVVSGALDHSSLIAICILRVRPGTRMDVSCDLGLSVFVAPAIFGELGILTHSWWQAQYLVKLDKPLTLLLTMASVHETRITKEYKTKEAVALPLPFRARLKGDHGFGSKPTSKYPHLPQRPPKKLPPSGDNL